MEGHQGTTREQLGCICLAADPLREEWPRRNEMGTWLLFSFSAYSPQRATIEQEPYINIQEGIKKLHNDRKELKETLKRLENPDTTP